MPEAPSAGGGGRPAALVVRLSSLGDVVLTSPVFENLKAAGHRTSVLVKRAFAPVFRGNPNVDDVLAFEERGLWGWAAEIRRRRFDLFIDLHDTPRSRFWGWCSGAARRVRYDKRAWERRQLVWTKKPSPRLVGRVVDRYLECLERLPVPAPARAPKIYVGNGSPPAWESRLGPGPFLGIAPGAAHATKRWPPERFAEAAVKIFPRFAGAGGKVLIFGAAQDRPAADAVASRLNVPHENLAGETTLEELLPLLSRCALVLTNDSGLMHAAAALNVPTVAVFGPTVEPFGFFPSAPTTAVVQAENLPCRPCHLHGLPACPLGHFRCMTDIPPAQVLEAVNALLR